MQLRRHSWTTLATGVFACLLIVAGSICYREIHALYENSSWVAHTHEVLAALEEVITTVTEAETGQRGYVITEQDLYLSEVDGVRDENVVALDKVKKLTADNADQQQNLARLSALVASRFAELQAVLELAKNHDAEAARGASWKGADGSKWSKSERWLTRCSLPSTSCWPNVSKRTVRR